MKKKTSYHVFCKEINTKVRTIKKARKLCKDLADKNFRVICDKTTITKSLDLCERIFRNCKEYPLNDLGI